MNYDEPAVITPGLEYLAESDAARAEHMLEAAMRRGMPWMTARQLGVELWPHLEDAEAVGRKMRRARKASGRIVSAPGARGYALREAITPAVELELAEASLGAARTIFRDAWNKRKLALARMTAPLPPPVGEAPPTP